MKVKLKNALEVMNSPMSYTLDEVGIAYSTLLKHINSLQSTVSNEEVEEALRQFNRLVPYLLASTEEFKHEGYEDLQYSDLVDILDTVRTYLINQQQSLTTPQISDNKVEELFDIVKDWTYQDYSNIRYVTKFSIEDRLKRKKALNQLKVKFQQMQQENKDLRGIIEQLSETNVVETKENQQMQQEIEEYKAEQNLFAIANKKVNKLNQQYKQLLDKIGDITYTPLDEESNFKEFKRLDNILKELKSIGGNQ